MTNANQVMEIRNTEELDTEIRNVLRDDVTDEELDLMLVMIQRNIQSLAYRFKNSYDKYLFDNREKLQANDMEWYRTIQYITDVVLSAECHSILDYVGEFINRKGASPNIYMMYYGNAKPDFNALSEQDKIVVRARELYRRLIEYFTLCEQLKRIEYVINDGTKASE